MKYFKDEEDVMSTKLNLSYTERKIHTIQLTTLEANTLSSTLSNLLNGGGCGTVQLTLRRILSKLKNTY